MKFEKTQANYYRQLFSTAPYLNRLYLEQLYGRLVQSNVWSDLSRTNTWCFVLSFQAQQIAKLWLYKSDYFDLRESTKVCLDIQIQPPKEI